MSTLLNDARQSSTPRTNRKLSLSTDLNSVSKPAPSPGTASVVSLRSRAESETDYEEIFAPRPRHLHSPTWLHSGFQEELPSSIPEHPVRVSSPLNPNRPFQPLSSQKPYFTSRSPTVPTRRITHPNPRPRVDSLTTFSSLHDQRMESPARRWVRWMVKTHVRDWILPLIVVSAVFVRWLVGIGAYSGHDSPPMFGDYEAQRHWMELTLHLPSSKWYYYDLPYWGLDYPPLTAYVSYACGWVADLINPSWVALEESRGFEDVASKLFMRSSVVVLEISLYVPAVIWFTRSWWGSRSKRTQNIALLTILLQPALILVDHGHFQYNSIMLGFTVLSFVLLNVGHDSVAAFAFVCSLCFKQMALYYSPAIFAYLLGRCLMLPLDKGLVHLATIGSTTIISFLAFFAPFVLHSFPSTLFQAIHRIFPLSRGLFEDKVANFWCASNVVLKWRNLISPDNLPRVATAVTLLAILPSMLHLIAASWSLRDVSSGGASSDPFAEAETNSSPTSPLASKADRSAQSARILSVISDRPSVPSPTIALLPFALFNSSMAFFLFSFQVHEKSILLPLLPLTLLMSGRSEIDVQSGLWEWGALINNVAVFSMWPLLKKDGQSLPYFVVTLLWNYLVGYNPISLANTFVKYLSMLAYGAIACLHLAEASVNPPLRYPDLYPVLNVLLCSGVFGVAWLWGLRKQFEAGWAIGGLQSTPVSRPTLKTGASGANNRRFTIDAKALSGSRGSDMSDASGLRSRKTRPVSMYYPANGSGR